MAGLTKHYVPQHTSETKRMFTCLPIWGCKHLFGRKISSSHGFTGKLNTEACWTCKSFERFLLAKLSVPNGDTGALTCCFGKLVHFGENPPRHSRSSPCVKISLGISLCTRPMRHSAGVTSSVPKPLGTAACLEACCCYLPIIFTMTGPASLFKHTDKLACNKKLQMV